MCLLILGSALLFVAVFPLLAFVHFGDAWQTTIIASKLLMLPLGAVCLIGAAGLAGTSTRR